MPERGVNAKQKKRNGRRIKETQKKKLREKKVKGKT